MEVQAPVFVRSGGPFQPCLPQHNPQPAAVILQCGERQRLGGEPVNPSPASGWPATVRKRRAVSGLCLDLQHRAEVCGSREGEAGTHSGVAQ